MSLKLEPQKDEILRRYDSGESCSSIASSLNSYLQPVTNLVRKYRDKKSLRHNQGNIRFFREIDSPEKAYFLGFIAADGCVQDFTKSSSGLSITIHSRDGYILEKLRSYIGCENPVYGVRGGEHSRFTLANKDLVSDLAQYDIGHRKSLTMGNFLKNVPRGMRKFAILGYFDGDGSLTIQPKHNNRAYVQIRGTEELLLGVVEEMGITSFHLSKKDSIPNLSIGSRENVVKFYDLYDGCPVFLTRKRSKFESIIQQDQTISQSSKYLDY